MSPETTTLGVRSRRVRFDLLASSPVASNSVPALVLIGLASAILLWGAASRDLDATEAPLGMAAGEPTLAPFGQVAGLWASGLLPGRVVPSQLWVRLFSEGGVPGPSSVHLPAILALLAAGALLARRAWVVFSPRAGGLLAVAFLGSLAALERPAASGFDAITGLAVVAAFDRILNRGSDGVAGLWAAVAVLCGGWPALAMIVLPTVVLGRRGSYLSAGLMVPPLLAFSAWSAWALKAAPGVLWGEALVGPLKSPTTMGYALVVAAMGLPWAPFTALAGWRWVRAAWPDDGRRLASGWLQVAGVSALAGTFLPGFAPASWLPILAGLALAAAAGVDAALAPEAPRGVRRTLLGLGLATGLGWAALVVPGGTYVAAAVPYYRPAAIVLVASALVIAAVAVVGAWEGRTRWAVGVAIAATVGLKLAHAGVYAPERDYRVGQGPWGRAIGQWVPPRWPIYVVHGWPADLAFATEHPFRQLASPKLLKYELTDGGRPAFVLLLESEFEHWPESAPRIEKVRAFEDPRGEVRVLARTEGSLIAEDAPRAGRE